MSLTKCDALSAPSIRNWILSVFCSTLSEQGPECRPAPQHVDHKRGVPRIEAVANLERGGGADALRAERCPAETRGHAEEQDEPVVARSQDAGRLDARHIHAGNAQVGRFPDG